MTVAAILILALCALFAIGHGVSLLHLARLRREGIYPKQGLASESDIRRLFDEGYRTEAIRCHREVHGSTLREAKAAIELLSAR